MVQDSTGLGQGEVSALELGELPVHTGGLEGAPQPGLLSHHLFLPALAPVSQQHVMALQHPQTGK